MSDLDGVFITQAAPGQVAAVAAIAEAAYRPYVARNGLEPAPLSEDYAARQRQGQLWVLSEDVAGTRTVRGFLVMIEAADHLLLDNIAVCPEAQGRGYGRDLMAFCENHAARAGFSTIRLYTQEIMVENIAIYRKRGYIETHRAVEIGLHRIYMEKRL